MIAAVAADADEQTVRHRGRKSRVAAKKPDAPAEPKGEAKSEPKSAAKHANAKPDAAPKATDKPDAKPAKPKAAAKPATKPAPKHTTGDAGGSDQKSAAAPRS